MSQDKIANLAVSIKNGLMAGKSKIELPHSRLSGETLKVLKKEGYLKNFKEKDIDEKKKVFSVRLAYIKGTPAIRDIKRVSTPGRRVYQKPSQFKFVLPLAKRNEDYGISIISTSKGIMTTREAKKKNIGGEIMLKVY